MADEEPIELEASATSDIVIPTDARPRMEEPPPVRLVAVADLRVLGQAGLETHLTKFYVGLWQFERDGEYDGLAFRAENVRLIFDLREGLVERQEVRPIGIEVPSLIDATQKLLDAELEYTRQRGLQPGSESLLLQDPAGNWVELTERREI